MDLQNRYIRSDLITIYEEINMAIIKKIKQESLLDKKIREIKEAIELFNLTNLDYEEIIKKAPCIGKSLHKKVDLFL